jgi:hypothetical protein
MHYNAAIGAGDHSHRMENTSPMSSNISSFYLERIEELLPEKKLVT